MAANNTNHQILSRELGLGGAVMMGLGSIVGTGVFVSTGLAAGVAGPAVVLAILLAAALATCNGLSSAQLAASHPVAGGTYEYGYAYLNPALGFTAGWMFLAAKSASAATAALGFAGYLLHTVAPDRLDLLVPVALLIAAALCVLVLTGLKRTSAINILVVAITLTALIVFVLVGLPTAVSRGTAPFVPFFGGSEGMFPGFPGAGVLQATALMFVAYTGYGRIATLGEEIREPRRNIPRAIIVTLIISAVLYTAVVGVAVGTVGAEAFYAATQAQAAPLVVIAHEFAGGGGAASGVVMAVTVGAITAMIGVLLNLILGLSRVVLAMGRRGDLPSVLGQLTGGNASGGDSGGDSGGNSGGGGGTPAAAVVVVGAIVCGLALVGSVRATWSFSAFTVLVYYGLTNAAALRLPAEARLYPRGFAWAGLAGCLFLAFWVEPIYWAVGLGVIAVGLVWHWVARRWRGGGDGVSSS